VWFGGLSADGGLAVLLVATTAVNLLLLPGLIGGGPQPGRAPRRGRSPLCGPPRRWVPASCSPWGPPRCCRVLAVAGDAAQTSRFYLFMIVSAAFSVGWSYLLRLAQPRMVRWLEDHGHDRGWRLTRALSRWTCRGAG
jgi:hypothetical protein